MKWPRNRENFAYGISGKMTNISAAILYLIAAGIMAKEAAINNENGWTEM